MAREVAILGEPQVRRRTAAHKERRVPVELEARALVGSRKHVQCDLHFSDPGGEAN